jgi:hypothetical protein
MATHVETSADASVTELVSGIMADARDLVQQQLALLRCEVQQDLRTARTASVLLLGGLGTALVGGILCFLMLVHLLSWAAPELPLWVCFGLVGAPVASVGGTLIYLALYKVNSMNLWPARSVQAFTESLRWTTIPK